MRIVPTSVTPLALRKRSAWMQYGHAAVEYIVTVGNLLLHGQTRVLPGLVTAAQVVDLPESEAAERAVRHSRTIAGHVVRDDRLPGVARELAPAARELGERDVNCVGQPAPLVFLGLADVEKDGVRRVDESSRLVVSDVLSRQESPLDHRPNEHD